MTDKGEGWSSRLDVTAAIGLMLVVQTSISLLSACIPVLAPIIVADRGWNAALVASYPAIVFSVAFLFSFAVPPILASTGGMALSIVCLGLCGIGILCLISPNLALMAGAPLAIGCASASMNPASSQVLGSRSTSRTAGLMISIKQSGVPLGGVLAGALVPWLVIRSSGWREVVVELAVTAVGVSIAVLPSVRWLDSPAASVAPSAYRPFDPMKRLLALPRMLPLLLASFVFTGIQVCLRTFFTVYLVDDLGISLTTAGFAFSASQAAGVVGQIGWAVLSDRLLAAHSVMAIVGIMIAGATFLTAALTSESPRYVVVAIALLFGGSAAGFVPVVLGEVARRSPPGRAGILTTGVQPFLMGGALVGPLAFGMIVSAFGFPTAFMAAAGCAILGVAVLAP